MDIEENILIESTNKSRGQGRNMKERRPFIVNV